MNLTLMLKNFALKFQNNINLYTFSREKQIEYLHKLPKPKNNSDRSYLQYRCQMFLEGKCLCFLRNLAAIPLIPYYLVQCFYKSHEYQNIFKKYSAVFLENGIGQNIIPESLKTEFPAIKQINLSENMMLDSFALKFILKQIPNHPFAFYFNLKNIMKLSIYCSAILSYQPKAIITYAEVSFCSSIITEYCNLLGIEHINVMHGEKLFTIRDAFFQFHRYYVWDQHYIELFKKLGVSEEQFIIEKPKAVLMDLSMYSVPETEKNDFTFYLEFENEKKLALISQISKQLNQRGYRIKIRPHPRNMKTGSETHFFETSWIEDPTEISIEESLANTQNAVGRFSTVLYQAYSNGISVMIDDMTNPEFYKILSNLDYIMLQLPHGKLSDLFENHQ